MHLGLLSELIVLVKEMVTQISEQKIVAAADSMKKSLQRITVPILLHILLEDLQSWSTATEIQQHRAVPSSFTEIN